MAIDGTGLCSKTCVKSRDILLSGTRHYLLKLQAIPQFLRLFQTWKSAKEKLKIRRNRFYFMHIAAGRFGDCYCGQHFSFKEDYNPLDAFDARPYIKLNPDLR